MIQIGPNVKTAIIPWRVAHGSGLSFTPTNLQEWLLLYYGTGTLVPEWWEYYMRDFRADLVNMLHSWYGRDSDL